MASYRNPQLRDKLAAEYVLGTLRGRARARFQSLLKYDTDLRRLVADWQARLTPMAAAAGDIEPPARLWRKIAARIRTTASEGGWSTSLAFWRSLAAASMTAVFALVIYLGAAPEAEPPIATLAVMFDKQARPAMLVSWPPREAAGERPIRVRILQEHPSMPANTSWELWMLPGGKAAPLSLGLVGLEPAQVIKLEPHFAAMIDQAWGVALTLEPKGGSPTGAPTGPVIFEGQWIK